MIALCALAQLVLRAGPTAADDELLRTPTEPLRLDLAAPDDQSRRTGPSALLEVRGWAGAHFTESARAFQGRFDLVAIIDTSKSTRHGSGADVNGDGRGSHTSSGLLSLFRRPNDPADSILRAEVAAVRKLRETLPAPANRFGLVSLRETAQVASHIGKPLQWKGALHFIDRAEPRGRTHMAAAIRQANQLLVEAPDDGTPGRQRVIVLLTDGYPTLPVGYATRDAIAAARESAELGIRIFTFALGLPKNDSESRALREAARLTRGRYLALDRPGNILFELPRLRLTGVREVQILNVTSGEPASMLRVFPNGNFDGFVTLREGRNLLRITARGEDETLEIERVVHYEHSWPHDRNARWKAKRYMDDLRIKLIERQATAQLVREMQKTRERLARELDVRLDEP